jgi:hypothetical protein
MNPNYVQVVAIADIRPYNIHRAFHGDWGGGDPSLTHSIRTGLNEKYGWKSETEARQNVKVYDKDYHELIVCACRPGINGTTASCTTTR